MVSQGALINALCSGKDHRALRFEAVNMGAIDDPQIRLGFRTHFRRQSDRSDRGRQPGVGAEEAVYLHEFGQEEGLQVLMH
jgi:hypothetical protein